MRLSESGLWCRISGIVSTAGIRHGRATSTYSSNLGSPHLTDFSQIGGAPSAFRSQLGFETDPRRSSRSNATLRTRPDRQDVRVIAQMNGSARTRGRGAGSNSVRSRRFRTRPQTATYMRSGWFPGRSHYACDWFPGHSFRRSGQDTFNGRPIRGPLRVKRGPLRTKRPRVR